MDNYTINDIRSPSEFSGISFSCFKKSDVKKELMKHMLKGNIEQACYWSAEYICAGHYGELWEIILLFFGKHIHVGNPKILIYIQKRVDLFKAIIQSPEFISELHARNSPKLRRLFAEIVCVLCLSKKQYSIEPVKINRKEEFIITNMHDRLRATSTDFIADVFLPKDPKELMIPFNEFAFHLTQRDCRNASYWIEWILEFDLICRKNKEKTQCAIRRYVRDDKLCRDVVWVIWDIFFHIAERRDDKFIMVILQALLGIFTIKYTTASCKKRRFLLYFGVTMLTEEIIRDSDVFQDKEMIQTVIENINIVYQQIKKNEQSPKTDYLFSGLSKQNNVEKAMKQIELVNSMSMANTNEFESDGEHEDNVV